MLLVYGDLTPIYKILQTSGLSHKNFLIKTVTSQEIPRHLLASDIGIIFRKNDRFISSVPSPIKFAEYLACGLPVVINTGLGDATSIVQNYQTGIVVDTGNSGTFSQAANSLYFLVNTDPDLPHRCRSVAEQQLSLDLAVSRYSHIYQTLAAHSHPAPPSSSSSSLPEKRSF